jgi:hypothetical protein
LILTADIIDDQNQENKALNFSLKAITLEDEDSDDINSILYNGSSVT